MKKEFITGLLVGFFIPILMLLLITTIFPSPRIPSHASLEFVKDNSCRMLLTIGCYSVNSTSINVTNFDANKDGKIDSNDTLFELCKNYYGIDNDTECKTRICGCS